MDGFLVSFWGLRGLEAQKFEEDDQTMEILVCLWRGSFLGSNAPVMALRALYGLFVRIGLRAPSSDFEELVFGVMVPGGLLNVNLKCPCL